MKSALSAKAAAGEIIVVDSIKLDSIKTKDFRTFLGAVKAEGKALVVTPAKNEIVIKSARTQIITCITFLNITIFEAADLGSAFSTLPHRWPTLRAKPAGG